MPCELNYGLRGSAVIDAPISYGVAAGAEAFANSVASGLEGVVVSFRSQSRCDSAAIDTS